MIPPRAEVARRVAAGACIAELETAFRHRATTLRRWYPDLMEQARQNGLRRLARNFQRVHPPPIPPIPRSQRRRELRAWWAAVADDGYQDAADTLHAHARWAVPERDLTLRGGP